MANSASDGPGRGWGHRMVDSRGVRPERRYFISRIRDVETRLRLEQRRWRRICHVGCGIQSS